MPRTSWSRWSFSVARSAIALAVVNVCILGTVFVTARTVRLGFLLRSRGERSIHSAKSSPIVFELRDWLKVFRVDAGAHSAQVIKIQPFGNGADEQFVRDAMSYGARRRHELSVASDIQASEPKPASAVGLWRDKFHEAFDNGLSHVTPFKSHRSGSRDASNVHAGRFYYTGGVA